MGAIGKLASALGRRDEIPNRKPAAEILAQFNVGAVAELLAGLNHKSGAVQSDCIKVLYEIGYVNPKLIAPHARVFIGLLKHKNNRLQWGAMTALAAITLEEPKLIYGELPNIIAAADKGSVITKDNAVNVLIKLCTVEKYATDAFALLNGQLLCSPTNQLPMYAERAMPIINAANRDLFIGTLTARLPDIDKDTRRKQVEKVISQILKTR